LRGDGATLVVQAFFQKGMARPHCAMARRINARLP
jgi:hypothetical protein